MGIADLKKYHARPHTSSPRCLLCGGSAGEQRFAGYRDDNNPAPVLEAPRDNKWGFYFAEVV